MLQVIISPAKQMQTAQDAFEPQGIPPFPRETERLHSALLDIERIEGAHGLQNLWGVSDRLLVSCLDALRAFTPKDQTIYASRTSPDMHPRLS